MARGAVKYCTYPVLHSHHMLRLLGARICACARSCCNGTGSESKKITPAGERLPDIVRLRNAVAFKMKKADYLHTTSGGVLVVGLRHALGTSLG